MSVYAQAAMNGVNAVHLAFGGDNAQSIAAFNRSYATAAKRIAAADAKAAAESNLNAINQDKILSNTQIKLQQAKAEALARVNAAAAGVEGQSVEDVVYETEKNQAHAIANVNKRAEQQKESVLARVNSAQVALLHEEEQAQVDFAGTLMQTLGQFQLGDLKIAEAIANRGK